METLLIFFCLGEAVVRDTLESFVLPAALFKCSKMALGCYICMRTPASTQTHPSVPQIPIENIVFIYK